jgi:hypothetical protein
MAQRGASMCATGADISPGIRGGIFTSEPHLTSAPKKPPMIVVQIIIWRLSLVSSMTEFPFIVTAILAA